jgi:D-alanine-D-alanine ligase
MTTIGVIFGGPSPEHDISILTGLQAARALHDDGADVCCLYWTKTGSWRRVPPTAEVEAFLEPTIAGSSEVDLLVPGGFVERRRLRPAPLEIDAVLNCCHGGPGEDGSLTSLLLLAGLRVSGPSPHASALAMDKLATAAIARAVGVPVIESVLVTDHLDLSALPSTPWVTKPRYGGSSIGVEAGVDDVETIRALGRSGVGRAGMLIQPFLDGWIDLNVAVRTHPELQASEIEKPLRAGSAIYGYKDKYLTGGAGMDAAPRELPADIPDKVSDSVVAYTRLLVSAFGLTGAPRIDFLWDGADEVVLCEVNAIPGAWGNHLWQASGVSRLSLYRDLIAEASRSKASLPQWSGTSDGKALRMSGSIAAKLS